MDSERPEKRTVRRLWVTEATEANEEENDERPLYLTLSGAYGKDIDELISAGLISRSDNQAIDEKDQFKVIAVESSAMAVLKLQKKFPGLKILEKSFQSVIRGGTPYSWPSREEEHYCRARVVNLDLNLPLKAEVHDGNIVFPVIAWITKLAQLHANPPRRQWSLCLTLHGEILWDDSVCSFVQRFLAENLQREGQFASACTKIFGNAVCEQIAAQPLISFSELGRELQQAILMVFVPKYILNRVQHLGWKVATAHNLRYGATGSAPMVAWICRFTWSLNAITAPDESYRQGLVDILRAAGKIDDQGRIEALV